MDIAKNDLEKIIKLNINKNEIINDLDFYKLLKETINVLIDLNLFNNNKINKN